MLEKQTTTDKWGETSQPQTSTTRNTQATNCSIAEITQDWREVSMLIKAQSVNTFMLLYRKTAYVIYDIVPLVSVMHMPGLKPNKKSLMLDYANLW